MWLIVWTRRQDIQQGGVADYTDDKTHNKEMSQIMRTTRQSIQQRVLANYTEDNTYNKVMWLITRMTIHTTKRCS